MTNVTKMLQLMFVDTDSYCVQVLQLVLPLVLQEERGPVQNNMGWQTVTAAVSSKPHQKPKIQHIHISAAVAVESVQILSEPVLPDHGVQSVHPPAEDRLPLHLLGAAGLRAVRHHHQGGDRRHQAVAAGPPGQQVRGHARIYCLV